PRATSARTRRWSPGHGGALAAVVLSVLAIAIAVLSWRCDRETVANVDSLESDDPTGGIEEPTSTTELRGKVLRELPVESDEPPPVQPSAQPRPSDDPE